MANHADATTQMRRGGLLVEPSHRNGALTPLLGDCCSHLPLALAELAAVSRL